MVYNDIQNTHDDIELSHDAIQNLSNAEGVVKFFTTLRYDTTERIEQTLQAMHFTSEKLRSEVQRIVRIASHDAGLFEVYLFEVRSLTVALRNEIVQRFRASTSDYLLVLTDNYERLDFVLTERYHQTITTADEVLQQQQLPISNAPTSIRSHTLQVERLKPNDLTLRVLRRFTYTEAAWNVLARIETLESDVVIPERIRLEIVNQQAAVALVLKDRERFTASLKEGITGAIAIKSEKRHQEVQDIYSQAQMLWPHEARVQELKEVFVQR